MLQQRKQKRTTVAKFGRFPEELKVSMLKNSVAYEVVLQRDD